MYCSCGKQMIPVTYYRSKRWAEEARLCTRCGELRLFNIEKGIIRLVSEWNRIAVRKVG
jgi:hypothetical protein